MKFSKVILIVTSTLLSLIFLSKITSAQWVRQELAPGFAAFDVRFIDKYTGWVCGENRIFKTTNSGTNWIEQPNPAQSIINQIHPVNENVVYAAGLCTILKTTNGGENWLPIRVGALPCSGLPLLRGLWFINEDTGWFCSNGAYVLRTINGCESFDSILVDDALYDIHFKNFTTGIASSGGKTFKTTNSGLNWFEVTLPHGPGIPDNYKETFVGDTGWTAGTTDVIFKTTNYGTTWDSIALIENGFEQIFSVEFGNSNTGYAGGDLRKLFKSTDGGYNWIQFPVSSFGPATYSSIYAYDENIVWAAGGVGFILYTTTGGLTNAENLNSSLPLNYYLHQNYPNPFNPETKICYDLPIDNFVSIKVYDLLGKEVMTLIHEFKQAGSYIVSFNGNNLSSGIYYYKIKAGSPPASLGEREAGSFEQVRKMILIK